MNCWFTSNLGDAMLAGESLEHIKEIFNNTMQENGNDLENPKVKALTKILVPGLIDGFNKWNRDKFNRKTVIELLAQMNDPASVPVYLHALDLEEAVDASMFSVAANGT